MPDRIKNYNSVKKLKIKLDGFRNNIKKKKLRVNFGKLLDDLSEFDQYIDIILIFYMICVKIFSFFVFLSWVDIRC